MGVSPGPLCLLALGAALLSAAAASTWRLAPEACPLMSTHLWAVALPPLVAACAPLPMVVFTHQ